MRASVGESPVTLGTSHSLWLGELAVSLQLPPLRHTCSQTTVALGIM